MSENLFLPTAVPKKRLWLWVWLGAACCVGAIIYVEQLSHEGIGCRRSATMSAAYSLELAIIQFIGEYGHLPEIENGVRLKDASFDTASPEGQRFLAILKGIESGEVHQNSKSLNFLREMKEAKDRKNGLIKLRSGDVSLRDRWGNAYKIVLDYDGDETLVAPADSGPSGILKGRRALVYSLGPDGKGGAGAVRTW